MFDTYDELVLGIADQLARSDLGNVIPRWIRFVEVELQRDLDLRQTGKEFSGTTPTSGDELHLPDDVLWVRLLRIDTNPIRTVEIVSLQTLASVRERGAGTTHAIAAAHVGNTLKVAPSFSSAYDYTLQYMAEILPLSTDNQTNDILRRAPDALFYGALMHSAPYLADDGRIQTWSALFDKSKESFKRMEWRARAGGGPLRIRPDSVPAAVHNPTGRP